MRIWAADTDTERFTKLHKLVWLLCFGFRLELIFDTTVKPVYNDHPRDPKFMAVGDRWSLFRGSFIL